MTLKPCGLKPKHLNSLSDSHVQPFDIVTLVYNVCAQELAESSYNKQTKPYNGAEEMARWVIELAEKTCGPENQSPVSCKKLGMVMFACDPSIVGWSQVDLRRSLSRQP